MKKIAFSVRNGIVKQSYVPITEHNYVKLFKNLNYVEREEHFYKNGCTTIEYKYVLGALDTFGVCSHCGCVVPIGRDFGDITIFKILISHGEIKFLNEDDVSVVFVGKHNRVSGYEESYPACIVEGDFLCDECRKKRAHKRFQEASKTLFAAAQRGDFDNQIWSHGLVAYSHRDVSDVNGLIEAIEDVASHPEWELSVSEDSSPIGCCGLYLKGHINGLFTSDCGSGRAIFTKNGISKREAFWAKPRDIIRGMGGYRKYKELYRGKPTEDCNNYMEGFLQDHTPIGIWVLKGPDWRGIELSTVAINAIVAEGEKLGLPVVFVDKKGEVIG